MKHLIIYCNNTAIVSFFQNNKNSTYTKHLDVKYQFKREKIHEHLALIKHVSIDHMLMDPLMKGLDVEMFKRYVVEMDLAKSFDVLGWWKFLMYFLKHE